MKNTGITLLLLLIVKMGMSQFLIDAEIRPRAEFRHGYKLLPEPGVVAANFISQRTRLNFKYTHSRFNVGISLQDVRVWGDEQLYSSTGVFGDKASIEMKEGWIEIFAGKHNTFKLGRQFFSYEDERLMARRNWNQNAITYDAFLYKFSKNDLKLHVGLSVNNNKENVFGGDYNLYDEIIYLDTITNTLITQKVSISSRIQSLNFLYLSKVLNEKAHLSFFALATGFQKPETKGTIYIKGTYGLFLKYTPGKFGMRSSLYYQNGKNKIGQNVSAYMFNFCGNFAFDPFLLKAGLDYISGQDAMNENENYQDKDHFFDIFYGSRHKYYGLMDYFSNMRIATANGGLVDLYGGLKCKLSDNFDLSLDYHYFSLQNRVSDPTAENEINKSLKKALASELDLAFGIKIINEVKISGGFSFLLPTESLEKIQEVVPGSSKFAYWGWLMLTAKPVLFSNYK